MKGKGKRLVLGGGYHIYIYRESASEYRPVFFSENKYFFTRF